MTSLLPMKEYPTLYEFLKEHTAIKDDPITHTRIGDKKLNVYGGSFSIPNDPETRKQFKKLYFKWIFESKKQEYLTEVQQDCGPVLVDLDFRYSPETEDRPHTGEQIRDLVELYLRTIDKLFQVEDKQIKVFVMEKPDVNMLESVTKDGIHMIIGYSMTHQQQTLLRKHVLEELDFVLSELPLTNNYESVLDDGITYGHTNWQMYGSRKPGNQCYRVTHIYNATYDDGFELEELDISTLYDESDKKRLKKFTSMMSAHYTKYPPIETKKEYEKELSDIVVQTRTKTKKRTGGGRVQHNLEISSIEQLDEQVQHFLDSQPPEQYEIKEIYEYVMALPVKYSDEYPLWIRVGWALHNMDHSKSMFLIWMKFSAKSAKFSFNEMEDHYEKWTKMYATWVGGKKGYRKDAVVDASGNIVENEKQTNERIGIVTKGTILFWIKKECPEVYETIKAKTIDHMIELSWNGFNEVDIARILFKMYGDKYACVSLHGQPLWYEYKGHRWYEIQGGYALRSKISNKVARLYMDKVSEYMDLLGKLDNDDEQMRGIWEKKMQRFSEIHIMLKRTTHINNIMKEATFQFFNEDFYKELDTNPYLMCCRNGVLDFTTHEFRAGKPEDYVSLSTHIDYIPISEFDEEQEKAKEEIIAFMEQLFPENDLNRYMWDHLASTLMGTNENQTFNIYTGSGRNGKSMMVKLMEAVLGDYKGTVPITLITKKRNNIGSVSPEVIQLKGRRYAVMQEPSKGDAINEGIMKELTGGDPIQGRALFKDVVTFSPQFKLAVCTNTLFDIRSNDDGTWRRIRVCDFMSKFTEKPYMDWTKEDYPYQFPVDKKLEEKFKMWKEVFLSLLVERLKVTNGNVEDCEHVLAASNKYREGQDVFADFVKTFIVKDEHGVVKIGEVYNEFKIWYLSTQSNKQPPKRKDLEEYMCKKYGKPSVHGWDGLRLNYEGESKD